MAGFSRKNTSKIGLLFILFKLDTPKLSLTQKEVKTLLSVLESVSLHFLKLHQPLQKLRLQSYI